MTMRARGAAMVELAVTMVLLFTLAVGVSECGRALLQIMNLSMVNLEAALLAGSINLVPGVSIGNGHAAIEEQTRNLMELPGQNNGLGSNPPLSIESTFTRVGTASLPPSSVAIDLSTRTSSLFHAATFFGGLGVSLSSRFVAPNFLGPSINVTPGFENPDPLVDCLGNEIPGCTSASCSPISCP